MIRREKEEELIFRGNQYARAINQYQRKYANASPANLDVLIKERFLRKKFKDPLSPERRRRVSNAVPAESEPDGGRAVVRAVRAAPPGGSIGPSMGPSRSGPIVGVASKNTGQSLRVYKDKTRYNEWEFIGMDLSTQAGPGAGQRGTGPQRGGPQRGDPQRGRRGADGSLTTPDGGTTFTPGRGRGPGR